MANLPSYNRSTKLKVVLAFGLLTVGGLVALYFAIISFRQISQSAETLAEPNPMPVHLNRLLINLAESESQLRAYSLSQEPTYLSKYDYHTKEVFEQLNTLKKLDENENWQKRLDTLTTLINKKVEGLSNFTVLKARLDKSSYTDKAIKRLDQQTNNSVTVNTTLKKIEREVKRELPAPPQVKMEKVERKGILNKIFGREKKAPVVTVQEENVTTTTREVSVDTIVMAQPVADSLVKGMKQVLREIEREESSNRRQLSEQELSLLAFDQVVMEQIRRVIHLMEQESAKDSEMEIMKARSMVYDASLIIFLISCTGLLTSFIFVALVIRDISRSNFLKNQLEKAHRKEEQLRQVKEQFLANMSHEIRTPLNAIIGFSEQLRQQQLPAPQQKQIEAIRFSSDFLLSTVNDILDMSKIEAGQIRFEKMDFDLLHTLQQTAELMNQRAIDKGLEFSTDFPVAPAYLKGDPFRLQQILYNLLGNAVKFTDSGEVKLKCRVRDNGFGKFLIDLTISDSGIGIAAEKIGQIFESFTQADASITRRFGGSGLGLAITKKLVDLQGGEISVRSREGKGTVFFVTIPYLKGKPVEQTTITKITKVPSAWLSKRVLVVDDDPLNILLLRTILQKWNIPTEIAESGAAALQKLEQVPFDLVLTDMNMPGMSGLQLLDKIRLLPEKNQQVPVVAVTANAMQADLERYVALGMNAYLLKPFQEQELMQLLANMWTIAGAEADAPTAQTTAGSSVSKKSAAAELMPRKTAPAAKAPTSVPANHNFSLQIYHKYSAGDLAALQLMLDTFLKNTKLYLQEMQVYCDQEQWALMKELAHKMFPSFKQLQADRAAALLRKLELEEGSSELRKQWFSEFMVDATALISFVEAGYQEAQKQAEEITPTAANSVQ